jgi:hypothetical protein
MENQATKGGMMAGEELDLEELLNSQAKPKTQVTIERVENDESRVRVTPFLAGVGCLCHLALTVPKDAVSSLTSTENVHLCCGKSLTVVEANFVNETLADVFSQLLSSAGLRPMPHLPTANLARQADATPRRFLRQGQLDAMQMNSGPSRPPGYCSDAYTSCMENAWDATDQCMCYQGYLTCLNPRHIREFC